MIWAVGFIILPLLMIIYYGLTSPDGGFTLENLLAIGDPIHYKALGQSLLIAFGSTCISLLIGNVIEQEFSLTNNWHLGSGLSIVLMVFIFISMAVMNKNDAEGEGQMIW